MIRILSSILFSLALYAPITYSGTVDSSLATKAPHWTGWYVGGNMGYLWPASSSVHSAPTDSFYNPDFFLNGEITRRSLVNAANNDLSLRLNDFMLGLQAGYNYSIHEKIIAGITTDFDWLFPSNHSENLSLPMNFAASGLDYTATINAKKTLSYLGTIRGRLGALCTQDILIYGTGGFAYGSAALTTTTSVINHGAPNIFPTFSRQTSINKMLNGWAAGGGFEWMFLNNWSTHIEYLYYDLGKINNQTSLTKLVTDIDGDVVPYASTNLSTSSFFSAHTIRVAVSGHFG